MEIKESTGASAAQIEAAALEYITPQSMRKVVRRPKTEALDQHVMVPFKDGAISTRVWGEGKTVLLVHGWSANQTDMFYYVPPLVEQGFRVVALDLPAHGESTGLTAGLDQLAEGVLAAGLYWSDIHAVIAHSIGCAATQLAIVKGLKTKKVVMLASPQDYGSGLQSFAHFKGFNREETEAIVQKLNDMGVRTAIKSLDFVSDFDTLPALIVHSIDDPTIPVSVAEDLASYWKNSELLKVDGLKHRGLLKDEKLINRVVDFVT